MQSRSKTTGAASCPHANRTSLPAPAARSAARDDESRAAAAVRHWLSSPTADDFPYETVVAEFNRVGKHLVESGLLEALAGVRAARSDVRGSVESVRLLDRFLDTALDKWDGRYANPTYLGLSLLPLPSLDEPSDDITAIERRYDRLYVQLIADAMRFEVAAAGQETDLLPRMRPDARMTAKRCRLGLQAVGQAVLRSGLGEGVEVADPIAAARQLWENLAAALPSAERRTLRLTMLPVSVVHDEYQFIRVLQSFEATFALMAVQLRRAVQALTDGKPDEAAARVRAAESALREAAPLFSLVATMQIAAFQEFREFTEGASAIQSRNYKLLESLCRQPDRPRLESAAYQSAPEVRQRVLAGQVSLDDAFEAARAAGRLSSRGADDLKEAMQELASTLVRWRRAHHRIAVRMLGERTGTGYTEGAPYLKAAMAIPVFPSLAIGGQTEDAGTREIEEGNESPPNRPGHAVEARGRCPFAGGAISLA